jgi:hypothetical protein
MALKLTAARRREVIAQIRTHIATGLDDDQIAKKTGLSLSDVRDFRRQVIRHETEILKGRTDQEWFAEYRLAQEANMRDLDMVIDLAREKGTKQLTAVVGAVRARAAIWKDMIETGQTLGLISRKPQQHEIVGGIAIANLETIEIRQLIAKAALVGQAMLDRYGGGTILDVDPGPIHHGPAAPKALGPGPGSNAGGRPKPHARTKVAGGRRVVREKRSR